MLYGVITEYERTFAGERTIGTNTPTPRTHVRTPGGTCTRTRAAGWVNVSDEILKSGVFAQTLAEVLTEVKAEATP